MQVRVRCRIHKGGRLLVIVAGLLGLALALPAWAGSTTALGGLLSYETPPGWRVMTDRDEQFRLQADGRQAMLRVRTGRQGREASALKDVLAQVPEPQSDEFLGVAARLYSSDSGSGSFVQGPMRVYVLESCLFQGPAPSPIVVELAATESWWHDNDPRDLWRHMHLNLPEDVRPCPEAIGPGTEWHFSSPAVVAYRVPEGMNTFRNRAAAHLRDDDGMPNVSIGWDALSVDQEFQLSGSMGMGFAEPPRVFEGEMLGHAAWIFEGRGASDDRWWHRRVALLKQCLADGQPVLVRAHADDAWMQTHGHFDGLTDNAWLFMPEDAVPCDPGLLQTALSQVEAELAAPASPALWDLEGDMGHTPVASEPRDDGIRCAGEGPCVESSTALALRVLPRPFSHVYAQRKADESAIIEANVAAFRPLYVFAREGVELDRAGDPRGWYQVGAGREAPVGWMQARDVFEWRQALLVSYTHPGDPIEGRSPVLMFQDLSSLESLVDDMDMAGRARSLYADIRQGETPASVVSMEPERFVDITRQFYMLPILDWEQTRIQGDDARLLQLAAAVPRARGADTLDNPEYASQSRVARGEAGAGLTDLQVDIVFVMDTTRSMQPFIDMTRDAVARMTRQFTDEAAARFRFGLVTYRDNSEIIPALEYATRNHTPELVDGEALVDLLSNSARATQAGSLDYPEEVFAGVDVALRSAWRPDALRFMILVGDASAHPKGHAQNVSGKDEVDLRRELDDAQVHLLSLHLQDPRAEADHPVADAQFRHLSRVRGDAGRSAIEAVDAFEQAQYLALVEQVTDDINGLLRQAMAGQASPNPGAGQAAAPAVSEGGAELDSVSALWQAALVEYIGREATPPKDIVAWSLDRDLVNPADRALDVRVLVTREQLSSLSQSLDRVVQALMRAEVTQAQFFEALQGVAGQTMKQPEEIGQGAQLADTGLLPAFIQSLPYRSDILSLTDEMFASMTTQQRAELEWSLLAKLEQYRAINEQVDVWFQLNDTDDDRDRVYPLHLDYLP